MEEYLVKAGIGFLGSLVTGFVQKRVPESVVPNDMIPANNGLMWGAGVGGATGDPVAGLSAAAGGIAASYAYRGYRGLRGALFGRKGKKPSKPARKPRK